LSLQKLILIQLVKMKLFRSCDKRSCSCTQDPEIDARSEILGFCGQAAERRLVFRHSLLRADVVRCSHHEFSSGVIHFLMIP
jgi:hypothetical protein